MIVLKPINTSQVVKFIPTREGQISKCVLRDDLTNVSTEYDITISCSSFFSYFEKILVLEEGKYYYMDLKTFMIITCRMLQKENYNGYMITYMNTTNSTTMKMV